MHKYLSLMLLVVLGTGAQAEAETVYFLVGEITPFHNDSYVLPLTDPFDIAHARDLIRFGPWIGEAIVVAAYASWEGKEINLNRNYTDTGLGVPSWSWYVTEFISFADFTIEILDGWPTGVELGLVGPPLLGFWGYTVTAELGTEIDPWCYVLDANCAVDEYDLQYLASNWLDSGCEYPSWCGKADLDASGEVDAYDFAILADEWLYGID